MVSVSVTERMAVSSLFFSFLTELEDMCAGTTHLNNWYRTSVLLVARASDPSSSVLLLTSLYMFSTVSGLWFSAYDRHLLISQHFSGSLALYGK